MKKWTLLLGSFFLILSFQNCQKAQWKPDEGASATSATEFNKTSASEFPILQMWDYDSGRTLDVDVASGHVAVYLEYGNERDEDRCLTDAQIQQLQTILSDAQVCEPVVHPEQYTDRVCTMSYRAPYAVLKAGADEARLGEQTNGCDTPVDLCADHADALRAFVKDALANIDQQLCQ